MQRVAVALSVLNIGLLLWTGALGRATYAQPPPGVVRGEAFELVDRTGQVRGALTVESNGEAVFRLRDAKGTIRVKLGASEEGSGLLLIDGATEPGLHVLSRRTGTTASIRGADGRMHEIKPAARQR
jgi:hypothetical protein